MGFFSNPIQSISSAVQGIGNDITNIPQDISSAVKNPAGAVNSLLKNPGASAIAGATISAMTGGAIDPITAAAIVGGTSALTSGNVTTGLMNGIGAYGGASLLGSATTLGSAAAQDAAVANTAQATGQNFTSLSQAAQAYQTGQISQEQYLAYTQAANAAAAAAATSPLATAAQGVSSAVSNPTGALSTLGNGSIKAGATALGKQALSAASPDVSAAAAKATAVPTSSSAVAANQQATINPQIYNRNPVDPASLNMIGAKYVQGAPVDTSERTYFNPTLSAGTPYMVDASGNVTMLSGPGQTSGLTVGARTSANGGVQRAAMGGMQMGISSPMNNMQSSPQSYMTGMESNTLNPSGSIQGMQQNMPNQMGVNMPNPNAPMANNVSNVYAMPTQMPVPKTVLGYADAGVTTSDPMDYGANPVTAIPADQIYAINPATRNPYAPDVIRSVQGTGIPGLLAEQMAQRSIASDPQAQRAMPAVSMSATGGTQGGHYNLGDYSDGGRLLRGPGDGISDSIPATIGHKQPARLADGEFVVPARIVSELGNGSTDAGARKLYAMLDRIQSARSKTVGKGKVARNSYADKYLPA
jgi:hypothetical protein